MRTQCPECSQLNSRNSKYCKKCGASLPEEIPEAEAAIFGDYSKPSRRGLYLAIGGAILVLGGICVLVLLSPLFSLWRMSTAAQDLDADTFSSYIDFQQLRSNLKAELKAEIMANLAKNEELKSNPFSGLAIMAAPQMVDTMVDSYVSPQGIDRAFRLQKENRLQSDERKLIADSVELAKMEKVGWRMGYSSVNVFFFETRMENGRGVRLQYERNWLVFWKLYNVKIRS